MDFPKDFFRHRTVVQIEEGVPDASAVDTTEIQKMTSVLSSEFNEYSEYEALKTDSSCCIFSLKKELNRLVANNSLREKTLYNLSQASSPFSRPMTTLEKSRQSSSSRTFRRKRYHGLSSKLNKLAKSTSSEENLMGNFAHYEHKLKEELMTNSTLVNTIKTEKQILLILRERSDELKVVYAQINGKYDTVISENTIALNNLVLAENQKVRYITSMKAEKKELTRKKKEMIARQKIIESETQEIIKRLTARNLQKIESEAKSKVLLQRLYQEINEHEHHKQKSKQVKKKLEGYRQSLKLIERHARQLFPEFKLSEPLSADNVKCIIDAYRHYIHQEASLSNNFNELSNEETRKSQECGEIKKTLISLHSKTLERNISSSQSTLRDKIDHEAKNMNQHELASSSERIAIESYWHLLEHAEILCTQMEVISKNQTESVPMLNYSELLSVIQRLKVNRITPQGSPLKRPPQFLNHSNTVSNEDTISLYPSFPAALATSMKHFSLILPFISLQELGTHLRIPFSSTRLFAISQFAEQVHSLLQEKFYILFSSLHAVYSNFEPLISGQCLPDFSLRRSHEDLSSSRSQFSLSKSVSSLSFKENIKNRALKFRTIEAPETVSARSAKTKSKSNFPEINPELKVNRCEVLKEIKELDKKIRNIKLYEKHANEVNSQDKLKGNTHEFRNWNLAFRRSRIVKSRKGVVPI